MRAFALPGYIYAQSLQPQLLEGAPREINTPMSVQSPVTRHSYPLRTTLTAALLFTVVFGAGAQALTNAERDAAEQRRIQEREAQLRDQQQTSPDARQNAPAASSQLLPDTESPCFRIRQLELRGDAAAQFGWVLDSLFGPQKTDSPLRKCLGTQGIGILLQRAQDSVVARGFVTTRVLAQPQDLSGGSLMLTVVANPHHPVCRPNSPRHHVCPHLYSHRSPCQAGRHPEPARHRAGAGELQARTDCRR
jgi:hypothetical protein